mmetsp:Transcript_11196/g.26931  ORF Transcript_11196/g.26931 Transcript_11196/m.26931 type:complete len:234 (+) Transcript_11196:1474-2175(+)
MWLQPPSLLMAILQLGQSFVFAWSQLEVSLSSWHFFFHDLTMSHLAGLCASPEHTKHHSCPPWHSTCVVQLELSNCSVTRTAPEQSVPGHHLTRGLSLTYDSINLRLYTRSISASSPSSARSRSTTESSRITLQETVSPSTNVVPAQRILAACPSSIWVWRWCRQQSLQKRCLHAATTVVNLETSSFLMSSKHTSHRMSSFSSAIATSVQAAELIVSPLAARPTFAKALSWSS